MDLTSVSLEQLGYQVHIGRNCLDQLPQLLSQACPGRTTCALITDSNVGELYAETILRVLDEAGYTSRLLSVPAGEKSKSMDQVSALCERMIAAGLDRQSFVIALGGGVVGDLAGFVAAIYYRGIPFIQVPTTIVAQVDSAVGGKTGVNAGAGKNLLGAFHQPVVVVADTATLNSLPPREFNEGFAEIIKHAAIRSPQLLDKIELFTRGDEIAGIIADNVRIKADIVIADERETSGTRALLNFGHTVGHAIENAAGYGELLHGEAISLGLRAALELSVAHAGLATASHDRIIAALKKFELPLQLPTSLTTDAIMAALERDKKFVDGQIRFVLIREIGDAFVSSDITHEQIREAIDSLR